MAEENIDKTKTTEDGSDSSTKKNQNIELEQECTSTETQEYDASEDRPNTHPESTTSNSNIPNSNNTLVHHKPRKLPNWLITSNVQSEPNDHSSSIPSSSNITSTSSQNEFTSPSKRIKVDVAKSEVTSENDSDIELKGSISVGFSPPNTAAKTSTNPDDIGPSTSNVDSSLSSEDVSSSTDIRPICQYGNTCYRQNPLHRKEYRHPSDTDVEKNLKTNKPNCWYGPSCYRKNEDHLQKFNHDLPKRQSKKVVDQSLATSSIDDEDDEDTDYDDPFLCEFSSDEFEPPVDSGSETDFEIDEEDEEEEDHKKMLKEARKFTKK